MKGKVRKVIVDPGSFDWVVGISMWYVDSLLSLYLLNVITTIPCGLAIGYKGTWLTITQGETLSTGCCHHHSHASNRLLCAELCWAY